MSRVVAVVALAALTVLGATAGYTQPSVPAPAPAGAPLPITNLVDQTVALFPQLEGEVIEAQDQSVTLSIGRKTNAQPGVTLEAFREGREIRHPRTGAVLGRAEEPLGRMVLTQVFDGYSVATVDRGVAVKPGDRVRTIGTRTKLALLSLRGPGVREPLAEAATNEVYEALNRSGRFQLGTGDQVAAWMAQEKIAADDLISGRRAREALQRFKIDNLLVLHHTIVERKPYVDARVFTVTRPAAALATAFFVPPSVKPAPREQFSTGGRAAAAPKKTQSLLARLLGIESDRGTYSSGEGALALKEIARLGFAVAGIDVAVAPSDQVVRMALSDGEKVYVYKIVNRVLEPDWTLPSSGLGRIFSVQLADLTGDGVLSVVANRFDTRVGMNSFIAGVRNGKPAMLVDKVDSILYAVDEKGTGSKQTLWSQNHKAEGFFHKGYADKMVLRNGSLSRESSAVVPDSFRATGATFSNLTGKNTRALAYIDEQDRLRISSGSEEVWRSSTQVGGGPLKLEVVRDDIGRGGRSYYYQVHPAPLAVDLDGDGVHELVVPQNKDEDGVIVVVYRSSAGIRFQQVKSGFEGIIAGFGAIPSEDGTTPTLITAVVRYRGLLKTGGETQIIMTVAD